MTNRVPSHGQERQSFLMAAQKRHPGAEPRRVDEAMPPHVQWLEVNYGGATFLIGSYGACEQPSPPRRHY